MLIATFGIKSNMYTITLHFVLLNKIWDIQFLSRIPGNYNQVTSIILKSFLRKKMYKLTIQILALNE